MASSDGTPDVEPRAGVSRVGPADVTFRPLSDGAARAAYAALYAASPQRTVFASLAYADAVCAAFPLEGRLALALGPDGAADVGAVLFEKRTGPLRQAVVPPLTPHTGPLLAGAVGLATAERLAAWLGAVTARYDHVAFHLSPAVADARPFVWAGFRVTPRYTYLGPAGLDGAPPYVRKMMRENGPRRVDGSVRETGIAVRRDDGAAADAGRFTAGAFERKGEDSPVEAGRAERLVRGVVAAGAARILVAERLDGTRVGAVATAHDDTTGHFWVGAGERGPSMLLLMAATAEGLAASGHRQFDLVGANLQSIATFKRRFGLPLVVYYRAAWTGSRLLRLREAWRGR